MRDAPSNFSLRRNIALEPWAFANAAGTALVILLTLAVIGVCVAQPAAARPEIGSVTGQLLVATPQIGDPRFMRTVIYMVAHDANGAMGLVVNRPIGSVPLARLLDELGIGSEGISGIIRVHYGGPVEAPRGFVLHTADYVPKGTLIVKDGMALTSQPEILRAIAGGTGPRRSLFALGYAGWGPGQLEAEIKAGDWVTVQADQALVFDDDYDRKWERAMARRIIDL